MMVSIGMVGGVGDMDGRGGTVGRTVAAAVSSWKWHLTLFAFLH